MMDTEAALQRAEQLLQEYSRWSKRTAPNCLTISISRRNLLEAVKVLRDAKWGYLSAITGLDIPGVRTEIDEEKKWARLNEEYDHTLVPMDDSFLVLYHFCEGAAVLTLRTHPTGPADARVPSICSLIPSATLYERELQEMFGIVVEGTPNNDRLILPDEWPQGVYPLRKSFKGL